MKTLFVISAWFLLCMFCWPLAIVVAVLWPLVWLFSLPFRLISITFDAVFALIQAILFLPARLLGYRGRPSGRVA